MANFQGLCEGTGGLDIASIISEERTKIKVMLRLRNGGEFEWTELFGVLRFEIPGMGGRDGEGRGEGCLMDGIPGRSGREEKANWEWKVGDCVGCC